MADTVDAPEHSYDDCPLAQPLTTTMSGVPLMDRLDQVMRDRLLDIGRQVI